MTHKQLLLDAAEAAWREFAKQMIEGGWNPLTPSLDTMELCTKLSLSTEWIDNAGIVLVSNPDGRNHAVAKYADHNGDKMRAWAWAATRAAAMRKGG